VAVCTVTALERLGANAELTDDPEKIRGADKVIFPGQAKQDCHEVT